MSERQRVPLPAQVARYCWYYERAICPRSWLASVNDDLRPEELEALLAACVRYGRLVRVETEDGPAWRAGRGGARHAGWRGRQRRVGEREMERPASDAAAGRAGGDQYDDDRMRPTVSCQHAEARAMSAAPATTRMARFRAGDPLYARAYELADSGLTQEQIAATLRDEFPGLPGPNYYGNPAAIAVMALYRERQQRMDGRREDLARLRAKGLPETLAVAAQETVPRPDWTDCEDDPDWRGPLHHEVDRVRTAGELISLCSRYDLTMRLDGASGEIVLNHRIAKDSVLYAKVIRLKPRLVGVLHAWDQAGDEVADE